jgi:hypothetical protein
MGINSVGIFQYTGLNDEAFTFDGHTQKLTTKVFDLRDDIDRYSKGGQYHTILDYIHRKMEYLNNINIIMDEALDKVIKDTNNNLTNMVFKVLTDECKSAYDALTGSNLKIEFKFGIRGRTHYEVIDTNQYRWDVNRLTTIGLDSSNPDISVRFNRDRNSYKYNDIKSPADVINENFICNRSFNKIMTEASISNNPFLLLKYLNSSSTHYLYDMSNEIPFNRFLANLKETYSYFTSIYINAIIVPTDRKYINTDMTNLITKIANAVGEYSIGIGFEPEAHYDAIAFDTPKHFLDESDPQKDIDINDIIESFTKDYGEIYNLIKDKIKDRIFNNLKNVIFNCALEDK